MTNILDILNAIKLNILNKNLLVKSTDNDYDYDSVIKLLDQGADINYSDKYGNTVLTNSIYSKRLYDTDKLTYELINRGADIHHVKKNGMSVLHSAVLQCNYDLCKYLIDNGVNLDTINNEGYTPLHTSLYYSVKNGNRNKIFDLLVENNTTINIQPVKAKYTSIGGASWSSLHKVPTPFLQAIINKNDYAIDKLVEYGADIKFTYENTINGNDYYTVSPILMCLYHGNTNLFNKLVTLGSPTKDKKSMISIVKKQIRYEKSMRNNKRVKEATELFEYIKTL